MILPENRVYRLDHVSLVHTLFQKSFYYTLDEKGFLLLLQDIIIFLHLDIFYKYFLELLKNYLSSIFLQRVWSREAENRSWGLTVSSTGGLYQSGI